MVAVHSIRISKKIKKKLDSLKDHNRETYDQVLNRILTNFSTSKNVHKLSVQKSKGGKK